MTKPIWMQRLLPASVDFIPFFVESHEIDTGRNVVAHEFPGRDEAYTEDTGKRADVFQIEAFVNGENYFPLRNAILTKCKAGKEVILVHPYLGTKKVRFGRSRVGETVWEGGMARFSITFHEVGTPPAFFKAIDHIAGLLDSAVVAVAMAKNAAKLAYSISQLPAFAIDSIAAMLSDLAATVSLAIQTVPTPSSTKAFIKNSGKALDRAAAPWKLTGDQIANLIDDLLMQLKDSDPQASTQLASRTINTAPGKDAQIEVFTKLVEYTAPAPAVTPSTPAQIQADKSIKAIETLVRGLAIVHRAQVSAAKSWLSQKDAIEERDYLLAKISDYIQTADDDVFQAFRDLAAKVMASIPPIDSDLADVAAVDAGELTPSLALAYDLWESIANESDILDRNVVRNPCFLSGEVEVLAGG